LETNKPIRSGVQLTRDGIECVFPPDVKENPLSNTAVILCVDDEPIGLMARRLILSVAGYTVLTAESGRAALKLFRHNHVDAVITDHLLSDFPGSEMVSEMKQLKPEVPIVLLTGLVDLPPGYEQADLVLTKGITPPQFLTEIARLLSKTRVDASETA
jgi:CheY-like chemotaxis protein